MIKVAQFQTRTQQQRVIDLARKAGKLGELCWIVACRVPGYLNDGQAAIHPASHPAGWLPVVESSDAPDGGRREAGEVVRFLEAFYEGNGTTFSPWLIELVQIETHPYRYVWGEPVMVDNVCPECGSVFRATWGGENVVCDECKKADDMAKVNATKLKSFEEVAKRINGDTPVVEEAIAVAKPALIENPTAQQTLWMELESLTSNVAKMREVLLRGDISPERQFVESFGVAANTAHNIAESKGWWADGDRNDGEMIALMHSELSEALEGIRHGNPASEHIPAFSAVEEEFADVIIRIMDTAHVRGWRVAEAIVEKMKFNAGREHKHGGKKF